MSEIEELVEILERMADKKLFQKVSFDVINQTSKSAAEFLRTLQPHDNVELVEVLNASEKYSCEKISGEYVCTIGLAELREIRDLITQPRPFDVQLHCSEGNKASSEEANLIVWIESGSIRTEALEVGPSQSLTASLMFITDWQPYTEPQLEDGLYFVEETDGGKEHSSPRWLGYNEIFKKRLWFMGSRPNTCEGWDLEELTPQTNPATNAPWIIETPEDT